LDEGLKLSLECIDIDPLLERSGPTDLSAQGLG
jgi:hypothetical protein